MESDATLNYFELLHYPFTVPVEAKYIIARSSAGHEYFIPMALNALPEVFHDDILREAAKDMGDVLTCIGGGRLKLQSDKSWLVTGKSSVYGPDLNRMRTVATLQRRFPQFIFITE